MLGVLFAFVGLGHGWVGVWLAPVGSGSGSLETYMRFERQWRGGWGYRRGEVYKGSGLQIVASLGGFRMHMQVTLRTPRDPDGRMGVSAMRLIWGSY
jgi:hypothetical protein